MKRFSHSPTSSEAASRRDRASRLAVWFRSLRAPFLSASAIPVLLGAFAGGAERGSLSLSKLVLTVAGVVCLHLGANLANDFFDHLTGCDAVNRGATPFSGGSRVIQLGLVSPRWILASSVVFSGIGLICGVVINEMVPGNTVLLLGIAGLGGGLAYSAIPLKLSYRGSGEFVVFALFGPLAVSGAYFVQTGMLTSLPVLVSVPVGLFVLAILLVNEVLDIRWDSEAGKRTLVVRLGQGRGYLLFLAVYLAAFGWIAFGLSVGFYPSVCVLAFLPLLFSLKRLLPSNGLRDRQSTINASKLTIMSHTIAGSILAVSYVV